MFREFVSMDVLLMYQMYPYVKSNTCITNYVRTSKARQCIEVLFLLKPTFTYISKIQSHAS